MSSNIVRIVVVLALVVVAVAAAFVETMALRVALVVVPALFLTQQALSAMAPSAVVVRAPRVPPDEDRRSDMTVRQHIKQLLELIRDFYSTCHMVAVGQLSPAKAKSKARDVEEKLNEMMRDMLDRLEEEEAAEEEARKHAQEEE